MRTRGPKERELYEFICVEERSVEGEKRELSKCNVVCKQTQLWWYGVLWVFESLELDGHEQAVHAIQAPYVDASFWDYLCFIL